MTIESELFEEWLMAKSVEEDAKKARLETEEKILDLVGRPNDESQSTKKYDDFKVTIKPSITRKLDIEGAKEVLNTIPSVLRPVKLVADEAGLKYLLKTEPGIYKKLSPWVETKEGKVGITVTRVG
jgi:hypothetical protein